MWTATPCLFMCAACGSSDDAGLVTPARRSSARMREHSSPSLNGLVMLRRLREKVEADPSHPLHLLTVRGFGYQWKEVSP